MSKKTLYLIGISVVIAFCIVMMINVYDMNKLPDPTPTPAAAETAKPQSKMAPVVAKMFDNSLGDAFGDNYTAELDQESGIFRVNTWSPETDSAFIEDAKAGGDALNVWEATVDRVIYVT